MASDGDWISPPGLRLSDGLGKRKGLERAADSEEGKAPKKRQRVGGERAGGGPQAEFIDLTGDDNDRPARDRPGLEAQVSGGRSPQRPNGANGIMGGALESKVPHSDIVWVAGWPMRAWRDQFGVIVRLEWDELVDCVSTCGVDAPTAWRWTGM